MQKSVSRGDKSIYKFHEEKNQHAKISMSKISFMWRKINVFVSRREKLTCKKCLETKSACSKCHEQNQFHGEKNLCTSFRKRKINNKFQEQKSPRNEFHEQNQFHERKNHCKVFAKRKATCNKFYEQNQLHEEFCKVFTKRKATFNKLRKQKSACNKFYEQSQLHEEKNQSTSFTKGWINTQQVPRTKISRPKILQAKSIYRGEKSM